MYSKIDTFDALINKFRQYQESITLKCDGDDDNFDTTEVFDIVNNFIKNNEISKEQFFLLKEELDTIVKILDKKVSELQQIVAEDTRLNKKYNIYMKNNLIN